MDLCMYNIIIFSLAPQYYLLFAQMELCICQLVRKAILLSAAVSKQYYWLILSFIYQLQAS